MRWRWPRACRRCPTSRSPPSSSTSCARWSAWTGSRSCAAKPRGRRTRARTTPGCSSRTRGSGPRARPRSTRDPGCPPSWRWTTSSGPGTGSRLPTLAGPSRRVPTGAGLGSVRCGKPSPQACDAGPRYATCGRCWPGWTSRCGRAGLTWTRRAPGWPRGTPNSPHGSGSRCAGSTAARTPGRATPASTGCGRPRWRGCSAWTGPRCGCTPRTGPCRRTRPGWASRPVRSRSGWSG